ncbi:MAG TPA: RluA family pseudouridine synthase [Chthoniobacterales bacterium]
MTTNIAAYKFARLTHLKPLRERLIAECRARELKGTILLSTEGVNLFVAGTQAEIDWLVAELRSISGLENLMPKYSESADQPFNRMLVRIKKEIISFGVEGIDPATRTSPKLAASVLKQWLDDGRSVTLLDTRNDYEVKLGTFKGAQTLDIEHFRKFPDAVRQLPAEMKKQPIVMFCTGGIRCEKAGPFMEREGFELIFQLDGGILKYFEECGGAHYEGECFVFDHRVGVDPGLRETDSALCFACQTPLTADDQGDVRFVVNESCPYCFQSTTEQMDERIAKRQKAIRRAATPLPGSQPYDQRRPVNIPASCDGFTLLDALCTIFAHLPRAEWLPLFETGRFLDESGQAVSATQVVRAGERYHRLTPSAVEPDVSVNIRILFEDEAIVVLEKPAPLPMHPSGRFNRNTLQFILQQAYAPQRIQAAHRLDANTTGLVVCARTRHFASLLQSQFVRGEVEKSYLVRVQGQPVEETFYCDAPISTVPGPMGTREVDTKGGLPAHTEFRVIERFGDSTLLEAHPVTGRTNQIRVHLWQLGLPVLGDPVYRADRQLGETQTLSPGDPPLCLHAWRLTFTHPLTAERMTFEAPEPEWGGRVSTQPFYRSTEVW